MIRVGLTEVTLDLRVVRRPALGVFEESVLHPRSCVKAMRESVRSRNKEVSVVKQRR